MYENCTLKAVEELFENAKNFHRCSGRSDVNISAIVILI